MKKNIFVVLNAGMILLLLSACAALQPQSAQSMPTQAVEIIPVTGSQYYFVTNKLLLPDTQARTKEFALNVDGDSKNTTENKFGELLTLLTSTAQSLQLQATLDQAVNTGQLVSLHVVQADDLLKDSSVSWSIFLGQSALSALRFDGSDKLTIDPSVSVNSPIVGSLTNGHFSGGPGAAHIKIVLLGQPVEVDLIGVHLETDLNAKGCTNGKIGGGITVNQFRSNLLPAIADGINNVVKADKTAAKALLPVFDSNGNGTITAKELENNSLLIIATLPDLDLLDASGAFNPGQDGVKDSYSIGLGFTCVPAVFTVPGK